MTLNKLALISKVKPDGSTKHRLVWDLLRSNVNAQVRQGERVVLPRLMDVINDAVDLASYSTEPNLVLLGTDTSDAFHQVPLNPSERRFQGKYYSFKVLVFGSASAPTVCGRYAAFAGRSTAAVCHGLPIRFQMYVGDPILTAAVSAMQVLENALYYFG